MDNLMVYDSTDGYVLVFGGYISNDWITRWNPVNETWSYSNGTWTNLTGVGPAPPPFKVGEVMVDDPGDSCVLLFTTDNQTWTFRGGDWTHLRPSNAPGALSYPGIAYDARDGYVLLFGGSTGSRLTWTFQGGNWTSHAISWSPWARLYPGMVYDSNLNRILMWGGVAYSSGGGSLSFDTWDYHAGNWSQINTTTYSPQMDIASGFLYDPLNQSAIVFVTDCSQYAEDIDVFQNGNWSTQGTCVIPDVSAVVFDPQIGGPLAFVGTQTYGAHTSTWATLLADLNGTWSQAYAAPFVPPPSYAPTIAVDATGGALLYYGYDVGTLSYSSGSWSQVPTPSALYSNCQPGQLTYDARDGYMLMYCGGELWRYQNSTWTQVLQSPTGQWPPGRFGASFGYDSADGVTVLFGGGAQYRNDTWTFSNGTWANITPLAGAAPSARYGATLVDDPTDGCMVLFGGYSPTGPSTARMDNDTWEFSGLKWLQLHPAGGPSGRTGMAATADPIDGGVFAFGGDSTASGWPSTYLHDTWSFLHGNWTNLSSGLAVAPESRYGAAVSPLPGSSQLILLGGGGQQSVYLSEWFWGPPSPSNPPSIPVFRALPAATDVGFLTSLSLTTSGGAPPLSFRYSGLPPGCTSANSATLSCSPSAVGSYRIQVAVKDSQNRSAFANVSLEVNPLPTVLAFVSSVGATLPLNSTTTLAVTATGGTGALTYEFAGLPPGCAPADSPTLSCQPTALGNFPVRVLVSDAVGGSTVACLNLTVTLPSQAGPPRIVSFIAAPNPVLLGSPLTLASSVLGGNGSLAFVYSGLPPGCQSQNTPSLECVPSGTGTFTIAVTVTDQTPTSTTASTSVTVENVTGTSNPPVLRITSFLAQPPSVALGASITLRVQAEGGVSPWMVAYSGLPAGCSSSDTFALECTPTAVGTYITSVTITDSRSSVAHGQTEFQVVPAPLESNHTSGTTAPASNLGSGWWAAAGGALLGGIVGAAVVLLANRRRRPRPPG